MFDPPTGQPQLFPDVTQFDTNSAINCKVVAINCKVVPPLVWDYVHASLAENTRRAYLSDLTHFEAWGGKIPSTEEMLASYLAAHAGLLSTSTLSRHLAAISKAHSGYPTNPARSALVSATMRGIVRRHRRPPRRSKPLLAYELLSVLDAMGDELRDVRDRALLLVGFAGAFRRSELVALDRADIAFVRDGVLVHVRRSKTDQCGTGRQVAIPFGKSRCCPVKSLKAWLHASWAEHGPVFIRIDRHGRLLNRLSGEAVSLILRTRLKAAGLCPTPYSGHSLRAGFATSAARAGKSVWDIRQQTGHKSVSTLENYIREHEPFERASSLL